MICKQAHASHQNDHQNFLTITRHHGAPGSSGTEREVKEVQLSSSFILAGQGRLFVAKCSSEREMESNVGDWDDGDALARGVGKTQKQTKKKTKKHHPACLEGVPR